MEIKWGLHQAVHFLIWALSWICGPSQNWEEEEVMEEDNEEEEDEEEDDPDNRTDSKANGEEDMEHENESEEEWEYMRKNANYTWNGLEKVINTSILFSCLWFYYQNKVWFYKIKGHMLKCRQLSPLPQCNTAQPQRWWCHCCLFPWSEGQVQHFGEKSNTFCKIKLDASPPFCSLSGLHPSSTAQWVRITNDGKDYKVFFQFAHTTVCIPNFMSP